MQLFLLKIFTITTFLALLIFNFNFLNLQIRAENSNLRPKLYTAKVIPNKIDTPVTLINKLSKIYGNNKDISIIIQTEIELNKARIPLKLDYNPNFDSSTIATKFSNQLKNQMQNLINLKNNEEKLLDSSAILRDLEFNQQLSNLIFLKNLDSDELFNLGSQNNSTEQFNISEINISSKEQIKNLDLFEIENIQNIISKDIDQPIKLIKNEELNLFQSNQQYKDLLSQSENELVRLKTQNKNPDVNNNLTQGSYIDSILLKDSIEKFDIKDLPVDKKFPSIQLINIEDLIKPPSITLSTIDNPFYKSQSEEIQNNIEIQNEINQELEYRNKVKQTLTQSDSQAEKFDTDFILKMLTGIEVEARGLNNNTNNNLLIYHWNDFTKALDAPNFNTGTQFTANNRHGGSNQQFNYNNTTNEIKMNGKCLDISGGTFANGQKIQLWDCNGTIAQKWIFNGIYIVAKGSYNWSNRFCLDSYNLTGGNVVLWVCDGTFNQRWVTGNNNFASSFQVNIHAKNTYVANNGLDVGHAFISYKENGYLVNTQSSWPGYDKDCNPSNKFNNICDYDAAFVDNSDDWGYGQNPGGNSFNTKSQSVSKRVSDLYRLGSGYRWRGSTILDNFNYSGIEINSTSGNCASFSYRTWNNIMDDSGYAMLWIFSYDVPGAIYNAI